MIDAPGPRPPRLLWVGAFPDAGSPIIGGFVTSCRLLLRSSFARRASLTLVDSTQPNNPAPPAWRRALMATRRLAVYVARFERARPDAVLLFASSTIASVAEKGLMGWYARLRGAGVLLFPRGGAVMDAGHTSPRTARLLRRIFGGAHAILCQGPAWHRFAVEHLGFAPDAAPVVPNWTATAELLAIGRERLASGAADRAPVHLVFAGWVNREKGTLELIEAVRQLRDEGIAFDLTLVGDGVAADEVAGLIVRHALGDRVRMAGWLTGDALARAYAAGDVFVLPSWVEGLPNAMIEAMAAGLAVVVSAVGTVPDVVTHEANVLLVPPRDPAALRDALRRVITDGALRRRLAVAGAALAATEFSVEPAAERILHAADAAIRQSRKHRQHARGAAHGAPVRGEHA